MLVDILHSNLIETLPNLHNIEFRLEQFRETVLKNSENRLAQTQWLVDEIESRLTDCVCQNDCFVRENYHRESITDIQKVNKNAV